MKAKVGYNRLHEILYTNFYENKGIKCGLYNGFYFKNGCGIHIHATTKSETIYLSCIPNVSIPTTPFSQVIEKFAKRIKNFSQKI